MRNNILIFLILFMGVSCMETEQIYGQNGRCFQYSDPIMYDVSANAGTITFRYRLKDNSCQVVLGGIPEWVEVNHIVGNRLTINYTENKTPDIRHAFITIGSSPFTDMVQIRIDQQKSCYKYWYPDSDNDGYGDPDVTPISSCTQPSSRMVNNNNDQCPNDPYNQNFGCRPLYLPENKNWVSSQSFDITGKEISANKSYFDDLGKTTQTQSKDYKTGKIWASQTLYDRQGRPALQTLSAPTNEDQYNESKFLYNDDFIQKTDGTTFSTDDFENNIENPATIGSQENTLGWYYSNNNDSDPYQDVTDRPYSRTIYSELNPGTVLKTVGGNQMNGAWRQGYRFAMRAGNELADDKAFDDSKYNYINYKIIKTVVRDVHGVETVVFTDADGRTLAAARSGNEEGNIENNRESWVKIGTQGYVDVHIPIGRSGIRLSGNSGYSTSVYDLITEAQLTTPLGNLPNGFYRISVTNPETYEADAITVTYPENYYDYSLNYYDKAGRLLSSKQPLRHLETTFEYNSLGQLTYTHSPDEGKAWFKYRNDGQIRFSQNSKQQKSHSFSYTNYDHLGRPIESGVYYPKPVGDVFTNMDPNNDLPIGIRSEVHTTTYDALSPEDLDYLADIHSSYANPSFLSGNVAKTYNKNTTTYYSYDIYGRVRWIVQNISELGTKTIDYTYDPITSQVTHVTYQKGKTDQFIHRYTYDTDDYSLTKVETSTNGSSYTTHAEYTYNETGTLKRLNLAEGLQGIDYVYNLNGALKSINSPNLTAATDPGGDNNDLFGMNIHYYDKDYKRTGTPKIIPSTPHGIEQYNGNIKAITWKTAEIDDNDPDTYYYTYNKNNWLKGASFNTQVNEVDPSIEPLETRNQSVTATENVEARVTVLLQTGFHIVASSTKTFAARIATDGTVLGNGDYNVSNITYDANGNIQSLDRNKDTYQGSNAMDKLSYSYKTDKPNQLLRVDDAAGDVAGADDIGDQDGNNYVYNEIGQLIENKEEKIVYIYNASGLVKEIEKEGEPLVKFFYNDKNHRVRKESYNPDNGSLVYTDFYIRDAAGTAMAIYRKDSNGTNLVENTIYGASRLGIRKADGSSYYQLTDHLGNVRAVVGRDKDDNPIAITTATDYYPGGMAMPGRDLKSDYRYGYQGEFAEIDPETGKVAFELRLYDPRINRWLTVDPAGQYHSPYMSMGNNWISQVDPDGAKAFDRYKLGKDGSITYYDDKGGDSVDYLFVEGDLSNEIRVTDTSILPQLESNSIFQQSFHNRDKFLEGSYAISGNDRQVKRLYNWIGARNSNEWTYIRANTEFGRKSFIGTLRSSDQGLNPSSGRGGFGNFSIIEHSHTHFGTALHDFQPSGSDMNYAARVRQNNPNAKFSIYSPLITKDLYNNAIKGKVDVNTMKPKYQPLRHEPSKYISY